MWKSKFFKIGLLFLAIYALPRNAFAFISPDTIQVVMSSIGPGILYGLVVFFAALFSFAKKIKNSVSKKHLTVWASAILTLFLILTFWTYYDIRFKSYISYRCCYKDACDIDYCGELLPQEDAALSYQEFKKQRFIDLNSINQDDYHSFQLLGIKDFYNIKLANDNAPLASKFLMNPQEMQKILINFSKDKKILVYFTYYDYSSLLAYTFYTLGYDAYYTALSGLNNDALIQHDIPKETLIQILPNIKSLNND